MTEAQKLVAQFKAGLKYQIPTVVVHNHDASTLYRFSDLQDLLMYLDEQSDTLSFAIDVPVE